MKDCRLMEMMYYAGMNILDTENIVQCTKRMGLDINTTVCGVVR